MATQAQNLRRYDEARRLWNEFDPLLAALPGGVEDEYDSYIGPSLRVCMSGGSKDDLLTYIEQVIYETMGLTKSPQLDRSISTFTERFYHWFRTSELEHQSED